MKTLPRTYWFLWTGTLVNRLGGFVFTFLAIYLTDVRHFTVEQAGVVVALFGVGAMFAGPVGGVLADRIGRRATMLLSMTLGPAAMLQLGFASSRAQMQVAAVALGFLGDFYRPAVQATVADVVPEAARTKAYGYLYWAVNLGFSGAALLAGLVAKKSFTLLFVLDAATTFAFGVIVFLAVPETRPQRDVTRPRSSLLTPFRDLRFIGFVATQLLVIEIFHQGSVGLPVDMRAHGVEPAWFGALMAVNGVLIVLLQPSVVRLVQRVRPSRALALGALTTGLGFGLTGLASSVPVYALTIVVWTLGELSFTPVTPAVVSAFAPVDARGAYQGTYQLAWGIAACTAPALGSRILGHFGGHTLWAACAAVGAIAATLFLLFPVEARAVDKRDHH